MIVALVAAYVLVFQALFGGLAGPARAGDLLGPGDHILCLTGDAGIGTAPEPHHDGTLPACCTLACLMHLTVLPPERPWSGLRHPRRQPAARPLRRPARRADRRPERDPGRPRAPPRPR
ncbi:hypothetical protein [Methylobrevis albus]|uniref:DUF2946 domain-containing protein n=1 Tax=Methylobrevis albus TaxID=2793297 RepID=A0A931HZ69_9HYPH|nr:hypothetical protein [Methylobrevis albus]MBH0236384.1 hypothetical protein [Methylobrevis albus]